MAAWCLRSAACLTVLAAVPLLAADPEEAREPVDLLKIVAPLRHTVHGRWAVYQRSIVSATKDVCAVQLPYEPPEEYDLEIEAERLKGTDALIVVLPIGRNQPSVVLDGGAGTVGGIERVDGNNYQRNETTYRTRVFPDAGAATVLCKVRTNGIVVTVDGKKELIRWSGNPDRLAFSPGWELPNKRAVGIASFRTSYRVTKVSLTPVTGEGKRLR